MNRGVGGRGVPALEHVGRRPDEEWCQLRRSPRASDLANESNRVTYSLAKLRNEKRFLALDLTYGHAISAEMYRYLTDNGFSADDYAWFRDNHVAAHCEMGTDYYETNEHYVHRDGRLWPSGDVFGYYVIAKQYFDRYRLPMMHTPACSRSVLTRRSHAFVSCWERIARAWTKPPQYR